MYVFDFMSVYIWQCVLWACMCFGVYTSVCERFWVCECIWMCVYNCWRLWVQVQWVWGCECVGLWKCVCDVRVCEAESVCASVFFYMCEWVYDCVQMLLCDCIWMWVSVEHMCECQCLGYLKTGRAVWCVEMCGFSLTVDVFECENVSVFMCVSQSWVKVCVSGLA